MLELYYRIWVDAIIAEKAKRSQVLNWKLYTIIPVSLLQGISLFTIFYWMKTVVNKNLPLFFEVNIFNARPINSFIAIVLSLFIPFVILNYLLIFNNDRYEKLLVKYKTSCAGYYKKYALITIGLLIIPIIIQKLYFEIV